MEFLKLFSPATVANVSCGFDALGFAIDAVGDTMTFKKIPEKKVVISEITGANLTFDVDKNVASAVCIKMLQDAQANFGLELCIHKGFSPGSGLGSSAASAAGAAYATNLFLEEKYSKLQLLKYAMFGEYVACGSEIADNVGAALYGGFVLIRSCNPLEIIKLPVPEELRVVALHPQIEIKTKDARDVLPTEIPLKDAVKQWANVGGLVAGLHQNDYSLISNSLHDIIVEPYRKKLIPFFEEVQQIAIQNGALGAGISGSGPTIFALCKGDTTTQKVKIAIDELYKTTGIEYHLYHSNINKIGIKILENY